MKKRISLLFAGGAAGAVNGLFGGGGGMIAVPALRRAGYPVRSAHATALAVVLPASVLSAAVYLFGGIGWGVLLPVLLGCIAGGIWGAAILPGADEGLVSLLFAILTFAAGVRMLL